MVVPRPPTRVCVRDPSSQGWCRQGDSPVDREYSVRNQRTCWLEFRDSSRSAGKNASFYSPNRVYEACPCFPLRRALSVFGRSRCQTNRSYLSLRRSGMHLPFEYHNVMTSSLYSDDHLADQLGCARAQHRRISIGDSWTTKLMHRRMATSLRCSTTGQSSDGRWGQCVKPDRRGHSNLLDPRTCRAGSLFLA